MASKYTSTFSPQDVTVVISQGDFSHIVSGFSEDSIVTVERNSDTFTLYTGADDTNTRIYQSNTSSMITLPLQQTSNSNDILSQIYANDRASRDSSGMFSITIKDNSGRSLFFAEEAFIGRVPDASFGNTMQLREWQIQAVRLDVIFGGNANFTPEDAASFEQLGGTVEDKWRA
ncbi:MAG: putative structural protein [Prokaryotic dsDNA virus sp.]|jgi:hypothetical protein|nr:MAG: putative structural protein [Prokaryotic dsDNA virus sp.]|tara:strand:- start:1820 stop:2341 length:522 start_codon:yes stop_codon:yes gene_type:complete